MRKAFSPTLIGLAIVTSCFVSRPSATFAADADGAAGRFFELVEQQTGGGVRSGPVGAIDDGVEVEDFQVVLPRANRPLLQASRLRLLGEDPPWRVELVGATVPVAAKGRAVLVSWLRQAAGETIASVTFHGARLVADSAGGQAEGPSGVGGIDAVITAAAEGGGIEVRVDGADLGEGAAVALTATLQWDKGPAGGHATEARLAVSGIDLDELRRVAPDWVPPGVTGTLEAKGQATGYLGGETTDLFPAEPLRGEVEGSVDLELAGQRDRLAFRSEISLDDVRLMSRKGELSWGALRTGLTGWTGWGSGPARRISVRMPFEQLDAAEAAAFLGIPAPWRPAASLTGQLEAERSEKYTMYRYRIDAPSLDLSGNLGVPLHLDSPELSGLLASINADVQVSVRAPQMSIGGVVVPDAVFGGRYWKDKVTLASLDRDIWDGRGDVTVVYEPLRDNRTELNVMLGKTDAAAALAALLPDRELPVTGRLSASFQAGRDDTARWLHGRAGLKHARTAAVALPRLVLEALAEAPPAKGILSKELETIYPNVFGEEAELETLYFDFKQTPDGLAVGGLYGSVGGVTLQGDGTVGEEDRLDIDGAVLLSGPLSADLAANHAWVEPLLGSDRRLAIPFHAGGSPASLEVSVPESYRSTVVRAAASEPVEPFEPEPSAALDIDLQPLPDFAGPR